MSNINTQENKKDEEDFEVKKGDIKKSKGKGTNEKK